MRDAEMSGYSDAGAVKGDVTGDGKLNVTDLSKAAAAVKGVKPLPDEQRATADVNSDGILNVTDVSKIAAAVKGIRPL
ncbi:MAG: dockerin type I repeat-containing protein [Ruminococcus sp.]|nr:dockerin type I repeat-containing protein [Ruminococcus sp.]